MATTEYLKEMRGLVVSTILGKIGERRDPELRDYMLDEAAVEIVAKGWVKTLPEFRTVLNEFVENAKPKKFGLAELKALTQRCGVEAGRYVALPFYCHRFPTPAGMTVAESLEANRRHWEAWREKCEEMGRLLMNFGNDEMCEGFDEKERVTFGPTEIDDPVPEGGQRLFLTPQEFAGLTGELLETLFQGGKNEICTRLSLDYQYVIDVIPTKGETQ